MIINQVSRGRNEEIPNKGQANKNEEMADESRSEINRTTLKSAVKLYTIIKNDILLENHFDLKTGSVNFFA